MSRGSSPKSKSILKNPENIATSDAKKRRLSFKPKLDDRSLSSEHSTSSSDLNVGILAENLQMGELGLYYVPPYSNQEIEEFVVEKESEMLNYLSPMDNRMDFRRLLQHSEGSATVMIVGEDILTGGFKRDLLKVVDSTLELKCVCKNSPSSSEALDVDFFLFLLQLDTLESMENLRTTLKNMKHPMSLLCMRSSVIDISSSSGRHNNVIPVEDLHEFLVETQLSSIPYSNYSLEGKKFCLRRIYEKIKQCCSGNNIDLLLNWGLSSSFTNSDILST